MTVTPDSLNLNMSPGKNYAIQIKYCVILTIFLNLFGNIFSFKAIYLSGVIYLTSHKLLKNICVQISRFFFSIKYYMPVYILMYECLMLQELKHNCNNYYYYRLYKANLQTNPRKRRRNNGGEINAWLRVQCVRTVGE